MGHGGTLTYIEKYQSIVSLFESTAPKSAFVPPAAGVRQ
jgi:hypothetical protein